jgi:hypothetical protein
LIIDQPNLVYYLRERGVDTMWHAVVTQEDDLARLSAVPFPCVAKPREGAPMHLLPPIGWCSSR